jgi:hypothetical protein
MANAQKKEMDEKEVIQKCLCPSCPSYVDCGEKGFCYQDTPKSKCIKKEQGCLCPACPVEQAMGYEHVLYCTRGNEKEQSYKR